MTSKPFYILLMYMSFQNRWTIASSYDFQAHQQRSLRRCYFSQTALLWSEVLPGLLPELPGAPRLVVGAPSSSEGRQECPPRVWYSPEIDTCKFTLHILPDTPKVFQWLKYILVMVCNGKRVIPGQRVQGSIRAVRAVRNTWVFLTESRVVAAVRDAFGSHDRVTQRCTWRSWSSEFKDPLGHGW